MTSMLWDVKGVPVQDKEVTSVLQYFSGAVLMVAALMFDEPCPAMVMFITEAGLRLAFGYGTNHSLMPGVTYYDTASSKVARLAYLLTFAQQCARWALIQYLTVDPERPVGPTVFAIIFAIAFLPYFYWTILTAPGRVHRMTVKGYIMASATLLGSVLIAAHFQRSTMMRHHRHDWRLLWSGVSQLVVVILFSQASKLPAWVLEVLNLFAWIMLWLCAGHKHIVQKGQFPGAM